MLTVPAAVFTVAWVVGTVCEITSHVRTERQNDIPLHNVPLDPQSALGRLVANRPAAAQAAPGGGGNNVSTTLLLLRSPVRCVLECPKYRSGLHSMFVNR